AHRAGRPRARGAARAPAERRRGLRRPPRARARARARGRAGAVRRLRAGARRVRSRVQAECARRLPGDRLGWDGPPKERCMSRFPSPRLDDKVAVVTGASSGIGYAIAEAMSEAGAKLVLVGRNEERLRRCAGACGEAHVVVVDLVADEAPELIVSEALAAFGRIDSIVHSAGIFW